MNQPGSSDAAAYDDMLTLIALAAMAYVLSVLAHEAVGHGGACLVAGGRVVTLWALDLDCDLGGAAARAVTTRAVAAAGPLVPLALGLGLFAGAQRAHVGARRNSAHTSAIVSAWMCSAFLILPNVGYLCLAAAAHGDVAIVLRGMPWPVRFAVSVAGCGLYWAATRMLFRAMRDAVGALPDEAWARGRRIAWIAYVTANALAAAAAARQAGAASTVGLSGWAAAIASLAGMSGLLWGVVALRRDSTTSGASLGILQRRWSVLALATLVVAIFIVLLAPGIRVSE